MLTDEDWDSLGLDPGLVGERAAFFEAFATLSADPPPIQTSQLAELTRFRNPEPGLELFGSPPGSDEFESLIERVGDVPPLPERPAWQRTGFEADALRQAAMAALLIDTQRGLELLARAAEAYELANPSFALVLRTVADPEPPREIAEIASGVLMSTYSAESSRPSSLDFGPIGEPQEINLALAASSVRGMVNKNLSSAFARRPGARSSASFGAGSATVSEWWRLATNLLEGATGKGPLVKFPFRRFDPGEVPGHRARVLIPGLGRVAGGHGRQLEAARLDAYHWRKFGGPAELIDLDLACATCIANRQLADLDERRLSVKDFNLPVMTRLSLQVGLEMAEPNEEPPPGAIASDVPLPRG